MSGSDVFATALKERWIYSLKNTPLLVFSNHMTRLLNALRQSLLETVARPQGFEEWIFPRMVPEEVLAKTGWLNNHREEAWIVDSQREFTFQPDEPGLFPKSDKFPADPLPYALDPIQCVSLYYAFFGHTFDLGQLPIKVFEYQGGWSHRYEINASGLKRGIEFLRLEFVWLAPQEDAIAIRNLALKHTLDTCIDVFDLEVAIAEGDSCFEEPTRSYDANAILPPKKLPTVYDRASVDILAKYENTTDLEVVSAGRHDRLAKRFDISFKTQAGEIRPLWSGCLGVGLTRLAAAFLDRHGFSSEKWPRIVRRRFEEG